MIYNIFFFWKENTITVYELHKDASKSYLPNSHIVLEQCTGLKDKNGKLIYEGDIVKMDSGCMCADIKKLEMPCIVEWGDFGFFFHYPQIEGEREYAGWNSCAEYEVIGNIHENPELLEDTTNCSQLNEVVTNCNQSEVDK